MSKVDGHKPSEINRPKYCSVLVTNNCMLKCKMCEMWKSNRDERELNVKEWKQVFVNLKSILDPQAEICFTGGEPLLKNGILELIRFAADRGFRSGLNTNAYLIDKDMSGVLHKSGLWSITISLESLDKDSHDFIRGVPGSYQRVMDAIQYLSESSNGLYIGISTVILDNNLGNVIDLVQWVQSNKRLNSIRFQAMMQPLDTPEDRNWHRNNKYNSLWPKDVDKARSVLDEIIEEKEKGGFKKLNNPIAQLRVFRDYFKNPSVLPRVKKCVFSDGVININHIGDVFLCPGMEPLGNIKITDIGQIWQSDLACRAREQIDNCKTSCKFSVNCFWE